MALYEQRRAVRRRLRTAVFGIAIFLAIGAGVMIATLEGWAAIVGVAVALTAAVAAAAEVARSLRDLADRIVTTSDALIATTYLGGRRTIRWEEIVEIRSVEGASWRGSLEEVRLIGADGRTKVAFTSTIPRFAELETEIRGRAPQARRVALTAGRAVASE